MTVPAYIRERAAAHDARVAEVQRKRREQMPLVAGIVAEVHKIFPKAAVVHADEGNGRTYGKPIPLEETLSSCEVLRSLRAERVLHPRLSRTKASVLGGFIYMTTLGEFDVSRR